MITGTEQLYGTYTGSKVVLLLGFGWSFSTRDQHVNKAMGGNFHSLKNKVFRNEGYIFEAGALNYLPDDAYRRMVCSKRW